MKQPTEARVRLTRRTLFPALGRASGVPASSPREANMYARLLGVRPLLSVRSHTTIIGGCQAPCRALQQLPPASFLL